MVIDRGSSRVELGLFLCLGFELGLWLILDLGLSLSYG
jgi:hypothetical protein